jgi:hypothetical protein
LLLPVGNNSPAPLLPPLALQMLLPRVKSFSQADLKKSTNRCSNPGILSTPGK